jgi:hypothetical protein
MKLPKRLRGSVCASAFSQCYSDYSKTIASRLRSSCVTRLLPLLLVLALPAVVQAQFTYTTNSAAITITGYTGPGGDVVIPSITNGLLVIGVADRAFVDCTNVTSVTLPTSITNLGVCAFWGCTSLASAAVNGSLTSIGDFAFADCFSLTRVTIAPSVSSIGFGAFEFCASLTNVTITSTVTNIGGSAFYGCDSLTSVFFQGNTPAIPDDSVFGEADNATVYYVPGTTNWGPTFGGAPTVLWNPQAEASAASFGVHTNRFGFNIIGTADIPLVVEACAGLSSGFWARLQSCTLTNGSIYFSDPEWTSYPVRIYRIRSP